MKDQNSARQLSLFDPFDPESLRLDVDQIKPPPPRIIRREIPSQIIDKARRDATSMGALNNSIMKGSGNQAGLVGEYIVMEWLGTEAYHSFDYDLVWNRLRVEVKTRNAPQLLRLDMM